MAVPKVQIDSILMVTPLRPSERESQSVRVTKDVRSVVFSRRFHVIVYYNKATENDSGWVTGGWMKESMGRALVDRPMLSGRLRLMHATDDDHHHHEFMEIVSNGCGVRLYEARVSSMSLMEVVARSRAGRMNNELVAWEDIDQQDPQFSPLFYVQVTFEYNRFSQFFAFITRRVNFHFRI
ncbi:uncharacterized protein LOC143556046 [Bidens hawaiensis]|uniref:uncharacterized protein LOC143556046 n=1 Tax=Bidens hawaiensis TaxID=980011 RepID=UPI00404B1946